MLESGVIVRANNQPAARLPNNANKQVSCRPAPPARLRGWLTGTRTISWLVIDAGGCHGRVSAHSSSQPTPPTISLIEAICCNVTPSWQVGGQAGRRNQACVACRAYLLVGLLQINVPSPDRQRGTRRARRGSSGSSGWHPMPSFPGLLGLGQGQPSSTLVHHRRSGFHPAIAHPRSHPPIFVACSATAHCPLPAPVGGVVIPRPPGVQCLFGGGIIYRFCPCSPLLLLCPHTRHPHPSPFTSPVFRLRCLPARPRIRSDQTQLCFCLLESHFRPFFLLSAQLSSIG